ncbi:traB domain-containing protein-like [Haliotis rufescens]|uniref:traB domain-containing protein-like n=1 Tax=Haliotis rufescens TaxID=6454 RepID=UPI00201E780C|nr:traB domain-containing protein-like [Haliotis rufescens]
MESATPILSPEAGDKKSQSQDGSLKTDVVRNTLKDDPSDVRSSTPDSDSNNSAHITVQQGGPAAPTPPGPTPTGPTPPGPTPPGGERAGAEHTEARDSNTLSQPDDGELGEMLSDEEEDEVSEDESGEETDIEDNDELSFPMRRRDSNPDLPDTVTTLETLDGSKVYVVGTAHFSLESQEDVSKVIRSTQPDFVMVELCKSRINILELDEATLLEEAKNINMEKIRMAIKQSGMIQGVMHLLLLSMSAHLTKELGMAPGGEFRRAFQESRRVPGCRLQLGDRPIQITLKRALAALSLWQKIRLAWYLITSKDPISKEDVEKCKQRDLLEQMLREMTGEFPALSRVFVEERDLYLAHSLKMAARPIQCPQVPEGYIPSVVVGVVGIGHVPGIVANWSKEHNIQEILIVPEASVVGRVIRWSVRASVLGLLTYGCYRLYRWTSHVIF